MQQRLLGLEPGMNVWCHLINIRHDMMLYCAAYPVKIYNLVYYTEQVTLPLSAQFIKCDHMIYLWLTNEWLIINCGTHPNKVRIDVHFCAKTISVHVHLFGTQE